MLRLSSITCALVLVGCADQGDEGMTVLNNTATGDTCTLTGDVAQPFKSHGEIFAFSPVGYELTPLIQSRVTSSIGDGSGSGTSDPAQRTIFLRGADISLTLEAVTIKTNGQYSVTNPQTNIAQFSVLFAGSLPPAGSVNVGFEVISPAVMTTIVQSSGVNLATSDMTAEVLADVTIRGDLGGDTVKSNSFQYPISVCTDCVVSNLGPCPQSATNTGNACNIFQDGVVDCCTDTNNSLVCPATSAAR
jgi:hypothetical protein